MLYNLVTTRLNVMHIVARIWSDIRLLQAMDEALHLGTLLGPGRRYHWDYIARTSEWPVTFYGSSLSG